MIFHWMGPVCNRNAWPANKEIMARYPLPLALTTSPADALTTGLRRGFTLHDRIVDSVAEIVRLLRRDRERRRDGQDVIADGNPDAAWVTYTANQSPPRVKSNP